MCDGEYLPYTTYTCLMTYAKAYRLGGTSAATNTIHKIPDRASSVAKYFTSVDIFDKINMGSKRYRYTTNAIHGIMERARFLLQFSLQGYTYIWVLHIQESCRQEIEYFGFWTDEMCGRKRMVIQCHSLLSLGSRRMPYMNRHCLSQLLQ